MRIGPISIVYQEPMVYAARAGGGSAPKAKGRSSVSSRQTSKLPVQFKLETYESPMGRGVRFVQPKGMSLGQMAEAINAESQRLYGRDAIYRGSLLQDAGMKPLPTKDVLHDFIPVLNGPDDKTRNGQLRYLEENQMSFAGRHAVTVAAGLFRLREGFPKRGVGTTEDKGDLLQGRCVRARSGALYSFDRGVDSYRVRLVRVMDYMYDGYTYPNVFAAGVRDFGS